MPPEDSFYYEGFSGPNGTIVPDDVFDVLAPRLKESELRVLLYIVRRTFGFGKSADAISLRQLTDGIQTRDGRTLDYGTGMSRKAVVAGVRGLAEKGIITVHRHTSERGDQSVNVYRLRFRDSEPVTHGNHGSVPPPPPPVTDGNHRGVPQPPPPVTNGNPQESVQDSVIHNNTVVPVVDETMKAQRHIADRLKKLGVHHNTVKRLLREHDPNHIERIAREVECRLTRGWQPGESAAAWLVAALRDGYEIAAPQDWSGRHIEDEQARERRRECSRALVQAWEEKRDSTLREQGIEQSMEEIWRAVQARLRTAGAWSPLIAAGALRQVGDTRMELLVPAAVRGRMERVMEAVREALVEELGEAWTMTLTCID